GSDLFAGGSFTSAGGKGAAFVARGNITVVTPEIAVEQPAGTDLTGGSASISFGTVKLGGSSAAKGFTIKTTGSGDLPWGTFPLDRPTPADFSVDLTGTAATVTPGNSTTFSVTFTPGAGGSRSAGLHITNDDSNENPFDITLTGTGNPVPEI